HHCLVMISRLSSINVGRCFMRIHSLRLLRTSAVVTASHHDDEPPPPYIPKPSSGVRNWLGELKPPREKYPHEPYKPERSDVYSFIGAGVGIILTVLAIVYYTDLFGKNIKGKTHGSKAHAHEGDESHPTKDASVEESEPPAKPSEGKAEDEPTENEHESSPSPESSTPSPTSNRQADDRDHDSNEGKHIEEDKHSDSRTERSTSSKGETSTPADTKVKKTVVSSSGEEVDS
uniref:FAD-dependent pyridine nucleotide-disulphide oxidoreductase domain containing protein n=1 Tax=Haemonchus contortus TaxID=6289 RepID=A0A7I4YAD7_HAECO